MTHQHEVGLRELRRPTRHQLKSREAIIAWCFVAPAVLGTLLFNVLPIVPTFYLSLTDWGGGFREVQFLGLRNYEDLFADRYFIESVVRTLIYVAFTVVLAMASGLLLALMVRGNSRTTLALRAIYFLPYITSQVAIGIVWKWMFDDANGPVNKVLALVGIDGPNWLLEPTSAFSLVVLVTAWFFSGYNMVLFIAGLQRIPTDLLDAASIDGAGAWVKFRYIILPLLSPTTFFVLVVNIIAIFEIFGLVYTLTDGGPGSATEIYMYRLYREAFEFSNLGYASAMSFLLILFLIAASALQFRLSRRWVHYS